MLGLRFASAIYALLLVSLSLAFLPGCNLPKHGAEPQTLRMNVGTEPPGIDWAIETDSTSFDIVSNLMVGLTQYTNELKSVPCCAKSWEITDGGRRYLFHLRNDAHWTDGKKVVAQDFEYGWKRLLDPKTGSSYGYFLYPVVNAYEYNCGKIKDANLVGVKALDDVTFEVRLNKPAAYFIYLTSFCPTFPQRQDLIEKWGRRWTDPEHMVTDGPFKLSRWQHEYKIELVSNEQYFEGPPKIKKLKMFMVPEQSTAFALYENDELDYVDNRSFSTPDVERLRNSPEYHNIALLRANYIGFNVTKAPFSDERVRRAVAMAIDRPVFPRILRRNEKPSMSWIPPTIEGHSATAGTAFDPVQARQLLKEAGYADGKNFPTVKLLYPNREDVKTIVEELQDQLRRNLGIKIELENCEWKVYLGTLHRDPPPIFRGTWGADYPDPETFMNLFTTHNGNNYTRFADPKYDAMIDAAGGEQNPTTRAKMYDVADHYLCNDKVPIVPVFLETQNLMIKPWVKGLKFNALDIQFLKGASIEP